MVSITVTLDDELKARLSEFSWVNWSDVGREESLKKEIFDKFIKTGDISKDDQEFCDKIDWDPIDELKVREEYIEKLRKIEKEPAGKAMTVDEFNKWCDEL